MRIAIAMRDRRSVREGLDLLAPEGGWPALSIVVPAHDEQRVIDTCASLLRGQDYDNLQIVFVADRCTDDTVERLRRHANEDSRIVVVENTTCPDDWAGKCHAAQRGAQPVACANLLRMFPFSRTSRARSPRPFANGQFMLFRREAYERIGGHEGVKD
ncbi:MAG: glycosyltransferase family 2 protein, partial [Planctomycetota bacterium]